MLKLILGFLNCKIFHHHTLIIDKELKFILNDRHITHLYYVCKFCDHTDRIKGEIKVKYHE
jgi:hypothetical protein